LYDRSGRRGRIEANERHLIYASNCRGLIDTGSRQQWTGPFDGSRKSRNPIQHKNRDEEHIRLMVLGASQSNSSASKRRSYSFRERRHAIGAFKITSTPARLFLFVGSLLNDGMTKNHYITHIYRGILQIIKNKQHSQANTEKKDAEHRSV